MLNNRTVLLNKVLYSPPAGVLQLMGIGFIRTPISFPLKGPSALLRSDASVQKRFSSTEVPSVV